MVVVGDDLDLAAVDPALGVDLVGGDLGGLRIDEPATACASAITPILIGAWSAAAAGSAIASARAAEAAPNAPRRGAARDRVTGDGVIFVLPRISIGVDRRSAWPHHLAPWAKAAVFALPMQADFSPKAPARRAAPWPPLGRACRSLP